MGQDAAVGRKKVSKDVSPDTEDVFHMDEVMMGEPEQQLLGRSCHISGQSDDIEDFGALCQLS